MKRFILPFVSLFLLMISACNDNAQKSTPKEEVKEQLVETYDIEHFKLFSTQNMWTFIKLDTQTGQMWQVQYSVGSDENRFEYDLNPNPLITVNKKINGRFELYSTQNIYNFILLDKIDGNMCIIRKSKNPAKPIRKVLNPLKIGQNHNSKGLLNCKSRNIGMTKKSIGSQAKSDALFCI